MTARLDVPIRFDTADGTRIHSPMVDAVVGGVATRLILDTGATDHVLLLPLIERSGAKFTPTDDGTDHAGASMRSWSVGMLPVGLGGVRFDLADVVAIEPPARFEQWGVGGFLSPQHLTADARICIDLLTDRLVVEPIDGRDPTDVDAALATRLPGLVPTTHRRDPGEATIVASAGLDGGVGLAACRRADRSRPRCGHARRARSLRVP